MSQLKTAGRRKGLLGNMTDTNLLTTITIAVFLVMYVCAVVFLQKGFLKPQTLFNLMNANARAEDYLGNPAFIAPALKAYMAGYESFWEGLGLSLISWQIASSARDRVFFLFCGASEEMPEMQP